MEEEMEQYLHQKYFNLDEAGSLGGVDALYHAVKEEGKHRISRKWFAIG